ncbi:hypothetical protein COU95_00840 [Candidatus Shapirobacteria bacterium CG10_big_fil_rev_8_21_14_0_10_40_9]|uniref:Glycosyltransferase 2-like domain-containing protein n=1 Tax=Candidatus Shapirobacteria bacterium CG10_big_fil_rev_8_21_14_0_10_40_9 TaxID=1974888 RepID=A0A2M8L470_9BACT|nr:MAG: hypothetical protein COU95_00840 [Candidatus Shapirobacteria bacterium CG10_big_fil_rev_8_21_14_0_10_40_9]
MKFSLVITVLNEEKTIGKLLEALAKQTKKPDEIIFVDGGSSDRTVAYLKSRAAGKASGDARQISNLKIFIKPGASIAQGRNFGIRKAKGEIIAMTDAGCTPHRDWFEKITEPFSKDDIDIVAGFYQMTGETVFQKCLACYLGILPEKLNPKNFMPSARSIAFRKEIWEKISGFSEKLGKAGEDTLFNYQARRLGAKFVTASGALVDWEMPKTLKEAIKKFYGYAKGDGQTGIWWYHSLKISVIYARYILSVALLIMGFWLKPLWVLLLIGFLLYLVWAVRKNYNYVNRGWAIFFLPTIQIVSDLAVMAGFAVGTIKKV